MSSNSSLHQKILLLTIFLVFSVVLLLHHITNSPPAIVVVSRDNDEETNLVTQKPTKNYKKSFFSSSPSILFIKPFSILKQERFTKPFRPATIEAQLQKYEQEKTEKKEEKDDNSVPISQEDLDYAYANWIHPFNKKYDNADNDHLVDSSSKTTKPLSVREKQQKIFSKLWNTIENYVAKTSGSNAPIVVALSISSLRSEVDAFDYTLLPKFYHEAHENVTILSVAAPSKIEGSSRSSIPKNMRRRIFTITSSRFFGKDDLKHVTPTATSGFGNFFISCNFVAQTFVFDEHLLYYNQNSLDQYNMRLSAIFVSLPMTLHVFAILTKSEVEYLQEQSKNPDFFSTQKSNNKKEFSLHPDVQQLFGEGTLQKLQFKVEVLVSMCSDDDSSHDCSFVVVIHALESQRACAKTWGAPLVQWGRKLVASRTIDGEIRFQVQAVSASAKGSGRKVHPLQYIPSINLDTLLGAGLTHTSRLFLLSHMVRTPRYSDPLPHNWVVGRGGQAIRIDRIDKRYDRDVDESKGYWGKSTRGYLHLLGHHLCLKIKSSTGLPLVMSSSSCFQACGKECAATCSYQEKGKTPCDACLECSKCVYKSAEKMIIENGATTSDGEEEDAIVSCHIEYSSMHSARKKWKEWEKQDKKNGNVP